MRDLLLCGVVEGYAEKRVPLRAAHLVPTGRPA
jgi:hypothetical protein